MKNIFNISILFSLLALVISCKPNNPNTTANFWVRGNCDMCKERIEKTVSAMPGVTSAEWSVESKMMKVVFDSTKVTEKAIQTAVAEMGNGTNLVPMDQKAHDSLPECCQMDKSMSLSGHDCCVKGASCCVDKAACCITDSKVAAMDCCVKGASCCVDKAACCNADSKVAAMDCCVKGASCCVDNADCCHTTSKVSTQDCCVKDAACCVDKAACCKNGTSSKSAKASGMNKSTANSNVKDCCTKDAACCTDKLSCCGV
jgi:mercuric ion binding protein